MKEPVSNRILWSEASKTALVFAAVTIVCHLLSLGAERLEMPSFLYMFIGFILWAARFLGCIFLMVFFMKKLVRDYDLVHNSDTNRYGRRIALFSAILVAAAQFVILILTPEAKLQESIDAMMEAYAAMHLDSNTLNAMEEMLQNLPVISFFGNLIYCFLYGTLLSAILSRSIPQPDPFADMTPSSPENE